VSNTPHEIAQDGFVEQWIDARLHEVFQVKNLRPRQSTMKTEVHKANRPTAARQQAS
jgi:hypothetical protein